MGQRRCGRGLRRAGAMAAIALATAAAAVGVPSRAGATVDGGGSISGAVNLPSFPCQTGCSGGTFVGTATLALSGLGTSSVSGVPLPYAAVWSAQAGNASAGFTFQDACIAGQGPTPPATGSANGSFSVTGGELSVAGGTFQSATVTGILNWTRVGASARLELIALQITAPASGGTTLAVNLDNRVEGESPTAFVWTNGPGTCAVTQLNQTALIEGVALSPA
jgi:hypothetical protein